jgi:hypothetical protein
MHRDPLRKPQASWGQGLISSILTQINPVRCIRVWYKDGM